MLTQLVLYLLKNYKALLYSCRLKTGNFLKIVYKNELCPRTAWALFICIQGSTSASTTINEVPRFVVIVTLLIL